MPHIKTSVGQEGGLTLIGSRATAAPGDGGVTVRLLWRGGQTVRPRFPRRQHVYSCPVTSRSSGWPVAGHSECPRRPSTHIPGCPQFPGGTVADIFIGGHRLRAFPSAGGAMAALIAGARVADLGYLVRGFGDRENVTVSGERDRGRSTEPYFPLSGHRDDATK